MEILQGALLGLIGWFVVRCVIGGFFVVNQDQRAVKTSFGRAQRVGKLTTLEDPVSEGLTGDERDRYRFPQMRVIPPGGPYFKWPWERVHKVSVATMTVNMAWDPESPQANQGGASLEAVTKDQLNTGLTGQIRYRISERNLYAYLFGVKNPIAHVMGYFVSVLRERIANFEAPQQNAGGAGLGGMSAVTGVSINDLRKNLRDLNEHMDRECGSSAARYGITLDASLITGIDPPPEVESALAAINTAHNQVSSDISLAHASADQKIVQSRRAVEIETLKAQAEVEPLRQLAAQLARLKQSGARVLPAYLRNIRLALYGKANTLIMEEKEMSIFYLSAIITFVGSFILVPVVFALLDQLGLFVVVKERRCLVYILFGKVAGILSEPGIHFLPAQLGLKAFLVNWVGKCRDVDLRLDQEYLRSQPVNSEEGAPMGIGIWYEMFISDPVAYLFRNADPRGSLAANVSNATVRCLSNMPLSEMLENRHQMSQTVRDEVTEKSTEWGYKLGSVYIRKVHFRDVQMNAQIEEKVVNRLRQVTAAIRQDGANQVSIITSTAERQAAIEFAKAAALRPKIVGEALQEISQDPEIEEAMFEIMENEKMIEGEAHVTLIPKGSDILAQILAAGGKGPAKTLHAGAST